MSNNFNGDISWEIYMKYYQQAISEGLVWTAYAYAETQLPPDATEEEIEKFIEEHPHMDAIVKVLTMEITIWVFRRLNGPWGEVIDHFRDERNKFINGYRHLTGYDIVGNEEFW